MTSAPEISRTEEESRLRRFLEQELGGTVRSLDRQPRWRSAWYAVLERDGAELPLYVRGDKNLDAEPYPGLEREAAILRILESHGIPVPHIHAMSTDPVGIVMDRAPGERDVSLAASDDERRSIAEQYVEALAAMHSIDTAPFVEAGVRMPRGDAEVALAFLDANQPLYERTKAKPEPLIEFALRWLRRNVPTGRPGACFVHADAGQFLFEHGRLTALYDFEASHLGDPLADLAALRLRDGFEPLGVDVAHLVSHYAAVTGRPVDRGALSFHTAAFALTSVMALAGPLADPSTEAQAEYLVWDLMCRRALIWALAECLGVEIDPAEAPVAAPSRFAAVASFLTRTLERLEPADAVAAHEKNSAVLLAHWAQHVDALGPELAERELDRLGELLGNRPADWEEGDAALERLVQDAGPERDHELLRYFARQVEEQVLLAAPAAERLAGYALPRLPS